MAGFRLSDRRNEEATNPLLGPFEIPLHDHRRELLQVWDTILIVFV